MNKVIEPSQAVRIATRRLRKPRRNRHDIGWTEVSGNSRQNPTDLHCAARAWAAERTVGLDQRHRDIRPCTPVEPGRTPKAPMEKSAADDPHGHDETPVRRPARADPHHGHVRKTRRACRVPAGANEPHGGTGGVQAFTAYPAHQPLALTDLPGNSWHGPLAPVPWKNLQFAQLCCAVCCGYLAASTWLASAL